MKWNHFGLLAMFFILTSCFVIGPTHKEVRQRVVPHVPNKPLVVVSKNGSITVRRESRADVAIEAELRSHSNERLAQAKVMAERNADGALEIGVAWPDGKRRARDGCKFTVAIPDVQSARLESSNGSLKLESLGGNAELRTSNGSIRVNDHRGPVKARSSNGSVKLANVRGNVDLDTSNGSIEAERVTGTIDAETSNGSIKVEIARDYRGEFSLKTSNGRLKLDDDLKAEVVWKRKKKEAVVRFGGASSPSSRLRTSNGSITVKPW